MVEIVYVVQKAQHPAETCSVVAESLFVGIAIAGRLRTLSRLQRLEGCMLWLPCYQADLSRLQVIVHPADIRSMWTEQTVGTGQSCP